MMTQATLNSGQVAGDGNALREQEIIKREHLATPGPWMAQECGEKCSAIVIGVAYAIGDEVCKEGLSGWPECYDEDGNDLISRECHICELGDYSENSNSNADFIVHARDDIAFLLKRLNASRAHVALLQQRVKELVSGLTPEETA